MRPPEKSVEIYDEDEAESGNNIPNEEVVYNTNVDDGQPPTSHEDVVMVTKDTMRKMGKRDVFLEERLSIEDAYLFQDETLTPVFCKSMLIPLKTITTQKIEEMQREMMEKLQLPEKIIEERKYDEDHLELEALTVEEDPSQPSTSGGKTAEVWTADD